MAEWLQAANLGLHSAGGQCLKSGCECDQRLGPTEDSAPWLQRSSAVATSLWTLLPRAHCLCCCQNTLCPVIRANMSRAHPVDPESAPLLIPPAWSIFGSRGKVTFTFAL